jgi:hypothetical protein
MATAHQSTAIIEREDDSYVALCPDGGVVLHYNGSTWRNYQDTYELLVMPSGSYYGAATKGGMVCAVGFSGQ